MAKPFSSKGEIAAMADVLARSFHEDPLITYLFPKEKKRPKQLADLYRFLLNLGAAEGGLLRCKEKEGAVIHCHSESRFNSLPVQLKHGLFQTVCKMGVSSSTRALKYDDFAAEIHKSVMKEPHLYLHTIGVDPVHQNLGHGSTLMKTVIADAEKSNLPIYLETSNEKNLSLYEQWGFQVKREEVVPGSESVRIWALMRE